MCICVFRVGLSSIPLWLGLLGKAVLTQMGSAWLLRSTENISQHTDTVSTSLLEAKLP